MKWQVFDAMNKENT